MVVMPNLADRSGNGSSESLLGSSFTDISWFKQQCDSYQAKCNDRFFAGVSNSTLTSGTFDTVASHHSHGVRLAKLRIENNIGEGDMQTTYRSDELVKSIGKLQWPLAEYFKTAYGKTSSNILLAKGCLSEFDVNERQRKEGLAALDEEEMELLDKHRRINEEAVYRKQSVSRF
jgi:hypothetical protein